MLIPALSPRRLRPAVARITAVLAIAGALSSATLAVLTHHHPGILRSADELMSELAPGPGGAEASAAGMDSSESSSDPRRAGSGTP